MTNCVRCGSKGFSSKKCSHGLRWCLKCGGHEEVNYPKFCRIEYDKKIEDKETKR